MKQILLFFLLISAWITYAQSDSTYTFSKSYSNTVAEFPGGDDSMSKFIFENTVYPTEALDKNKQGKVHIKFRVTSTGDIEDVITTDKVKLGYGIEEEAIRIIKKMPKWKPATHSNIAVPSYINIPLTFKIY